MCSVGRCLIDPQSKDLKDEFGIQLKIQDVQLFEEKLKEEYRGHCINFWQLLQDWHDYGKFTVEERDFLLKARIFAGKLENDNDYWRAINDLFVSLYLK